MGDVTDITDPVEQVCWLASRDGGQVDMRRRRSPRAGMKIDAALLAGAIRRDGSLTPYGWVLAGKAEARSDDD